MGKPVCNCEVPASEDVVAAAVAAGLPVHDEKQAVAVVKRGGVTWLMLEDGTEVIRDADGQFIDEWPEV